MFTFLIFTKPIIANGQLEVKGRFLDKEGIPVSKANVTLLKDSVVAFEVYSDSAGYYLFDNVKPAVYVLQGSYVGMDKYQETVSIRSDTIINVILSSDIPVKLEEVTIVGKKQLIERKVDRLIFNLSNSISATGGTALDALRIAPGLVVQNDQISMMGKSNMNVMLNGRILQLAGDDLTNFLKTLRSDDIERIEIITNPPSKYDAQGNSGLVNIVTKGVKMNSYNGSITSSLSQANKSIGSGGLTLNYQRNRLTLLSNISYTKGSSEPYQNYTLKYPSYVWSEDNRRVSFINNLGARISLDYKINHKVKVGVEYLHSGSKPSVDAHIHSSIFGNESGTLDSSIINITDRDTRQFSNTFNVYSVIDLDTNGRKINVDFNHLKYNSSINNDFYSNSYDDVGGLKPDNYYSATNRGGLDIAITTAGIDFEIPAKWASLNFGSKLSFIDNSSNIEFFNTSSGYPDSIQLNRFNYKENTQALYLSATKKLNQKLEVQLGFRGENTQTEGFSETLGSSNKNDFFRLFPTFYLLYSFTNNKNIALTYDRRIDRPPYNHLNPFRRYSNAFNYSEGNPFLQPYITNNVQASFTYKNLSSAIYSTFISNQFDQVTFVDPNTNIQRVTPVNFYDQTNVGLMQQYSFSLKERWENHSGAIIFYAKSKSRISEVPNIEGFSSKVQTNNAYVLDKEKKFKLELNYFYQFPSIAGSYRLSEFSQLDLGISGTFLKNNNLQVTVNALDLLKTGKRTFSQSVNGIDQDNFDYPDLRRVRISVSYNFGKTFNTNKKNNNLIREEEQRLK
jgi:hypothetical protein